MEASSPTLKYPAANLGSLPLWTEGGWNKEALLIRRQSIGPRAFERGYRQKALSDEDKLFPHFSACKKPVKINDILNSTWGFYGGVDLSSESVPGNVVFTLAQSPEGKRMPVEIRQGNWKSSRTVQEIIDACEKWKPEVVNVENNALQVAILQWALDKNASLPLQGFCTGKNKADESIGLPGLEVEFANDAWIIPMGEVEGHDLGCDCPWCIWLQGMEEYPQVEPSYTHSVMACWFAREAARGTATPGLFFAGGN